MLRKLLVSPGGVYDVVQYRNVYIINFAFVFIVPPALLKSDLTVHYPFTTNERTIFEKKIKERKSVTDDFFVRTRFSFVSLFSLLRK